MATKTALKQSAKITEKKTSKATVPGPDAPALTGLTSGIQGPPAIRTPHLTLKVGVPSTSNAANLIVSGTAFPRKADIVLEYYYRSRDHVFTSARTRVNVKTDDLGDFEKKVAVRHVIHSYQYQLFVEAYRKDIILAVATMPLSTVVG